MSWSPCYRFRSRRRIGWAGACAVLLEQPLIEAKSFNGKLRDECLGMQWFKKRVKAKAVIEDWRRGYNERRPHSCLGNLTPTEYAKSH